MRCVIGKDLQLCVQVKGEEDCRCKATGSMAARKSLEPTLNVRVCSQVELEGDHINIRSVYIMRVPLAECCIETVYFLMETCDDRIPVWLASFKVIGSEATDEMLLDGTNEGPAKFKFVRLGRGNIETENIWRCTLKLEP